MSGAKKVRWACLDLYNFFLSASTERGEIPSGESLKGEKTVNLLYFMRNEVIYRTSSQ